MHQIGHNERGMHAQNFGQNIIFFILLFTMFKRCISNDQPIF